MDIPNLRLPNLHYCIATFLIHYTSSYAHAQNFTTSSSSSSEILDTFCSHDTCTNGDCYVVGTEVKCSCGDLYSGELCEIVNLDRVEIIVIGSMVIFKWPRPPRLKGYSLLYYCVDEPNKIIYKHDIALTDRESSVLVGNFRNGIATYRICITSQYNADIAVESMESLSNCVNVTTHLDYHSFAGWLLAALSCVGAVTLVYFQKDKIELLYFHRPSAIGVQYNYNVEELIKNEKLRKERELNGSHNLQEVVHVYNHKDEGNLNKVTLETIKDE